MLVCVLVCWWCIVHACMHVCYIPTYLRTYGLIYHTLHLHASIHPRSTTWIFAQSCLRRGSCKSAGRVGVMFATLHLTRATACTRSCSCPVLWIEQASSAWAWIWTPSMRRTCCSSESKYRGSKQATLANSRYDGLI
jgi:hypothetical protein